jgi:hypothetical protein
MPTRVLALLFLLSSHAAADPPRAKLNPEVLDQKIEEVIHEPRFSWRLPRQPEKDEDAKAGFLVRFIRQLLKSFAKGFSAFWEWLRELLRDKEDRIDARGGPPRQLLQASLYALVFIVAAAAAFLFWRSPRTKTSAAETLPLAPAIDLTSAEISPALLEEDGWLALAREFLEKNEPLMALRAYYLAGLAFLGRKELVRTSAAKSNREYRTELARRSRSTPEMAPIFDRNVVIFERCWFGGRPVERQSLDEFLANLERIRTLAQ